MFKCLQTQGLLHDTYVYGVDAKQIVPTLIYPTGNNGWCNCKW